MIKALLALAVPLGKLLNMIILLIKPSLGKKESEIGKSNSDNEESFKKDGRPK